MRERDDWCSEYRIRRTVENYRRYVHTLGLLSGLAVLFLARSIFFYEVDFRSFPSYATVYSGTLAVSLVFRVILKALYNREKHTRLDAAITLVTALILFLMVNLCLLDSFFVSDVDFTAYIFATFMFAFIHRSAWPVALILFLSSMICYTGAYYVLRPDLFNVPSLLPLGPITLLAFYFSWNRENMNCRLFKTGYELAESNRKLIDQSRRDALTGLHNRRFMEDFLEHQIALYRRQKTDFSLIFTDIDHFKRVNDELGHTVGDKVLRDFAQILEKESRETDLVVRYGGEEFLIVLPETRQNEALKLAERIRKAVERRAFSSVPWVLTASFGISGIREELCGADSLMCRVDELLYMAKREGRNRCAALSFQPPLHT